jgi:hypothetical protein
LSTNPRKEVAKSANHAVKKKVSDERERERKRERVGECCCSESLLTVLRVLERERDLRVSESFEGVTRVRESVCVERERGEA